MLESLTSHLAEVPLETWFVVTVLLLVATVFLYVVFSGLLHSVTVSTSVTSVTTVTLVTVVGTLVTSVTSVTTVTLVTVVGTPATSVTTVTVVNSGGW